MKIKKKLQISNHNQVDQKPLSHPKWWPLELFRVETMSSLEEYALPSMRFLCCSCLWESSGPLGLPTRAPSLELVIRECFWKDHADSEWVVYLRDARVWWLQAIQARKNGSLDKCGDNEDEREVDIFERNLRAETDRSWRRWTVSNSPKREAREHDPLIYGGGDYIHYDFRIDCPELNALK